MACFLLQADRFFDACARGARFVSCLILLVKVVFLRFFAFVFIVFAFASHNM